MHASPKHGYRFISVALISITTSAASGSILVGNLDEPFRDATPIANPEYWGAQSFVVDTQSHALSWIDALVGEGFSDPGVVAELRSANASGEIDQSAAGLLTTFVAPD